MHPNDIRAMWPKFDELGATCESPDTKALIGAIKLFAEMFNGRVAQLEINSTEIRRAVADMAAAKR